MRHLRYALRTLRRHRSYAVLGIVTLGLAIGANIVVFSVARGLLLRPLPIAHPDRVQFVVPGTLFTTSFPAYLDLRARNRSFEDMAGYRVAPMAMTSDAGARRIWGYLVTGSYFPMLGVRPELGRLLTPADDARPDAEPYAVLSHAFWQQAFGANPQIVGQTIRINDRPYTVVGVAPQEFIGTEVIYRPDVWIPMAMQGHIEGRSWLNNRFTKNTMVVGRLAPGVSPAAAAADLISISRQISREHPDSDVPIAFRLVRPGLFGDTPRTTAASMLGGVMVLAALALLAACANLGGLLASRVIDRSREIGVRLALGANRFDLVRDLLTETLLLATAATAAAYLAASAILRVLSGWSPADMPFQLDVTPDPIVVAFAVATTVVVALSASLAAARRTWVVEVASLAAPSYAHARADTSRRMPILGGHRWSTREWLLAAQIAVCSVLLTASAVAIQGVRAAATAPIGIAPGHVSIVTVDLGLFGYTRERALDFDARLLDAVSRISGVSRAALSTTVPLSIDQSTTGLFREDETVFTPPRSFEASYYYVSPGYFSTVGTRLLEGRDFTDHDDPNGPPVAIVNETLARRVVGTVHAVGRRVRMNNRLVEIIAVAEDGKYRTLTEAPQLALFRPRRQVNDTTVAVLLRSDLPADQLVPQVRAAIASIDARVPVLYQGPLKEVMAVAFLPSNAAGIALAAFGLLAVLLTVTGVYSVAAFAVSRRTFEIGIRVAIGARRGQVLRTILGRTFGCVSIGGIVGFVAGINASRLLENVVYQASPRDPIVVLAAVGVLAGVAVVATFGPARRALAIEPSVALREG